jgi:hypothetical protein
MPPKAAATSNEDCRPPLSNTHLTAQNIRRLMRSEEWNAIESRHVQIVYLVEFTQTECGLELDNRTLVNIFQLTRLAFTKSKLRVTHLQNRHIVHRSGHGSRRSDCRVRYEQDISWYFCDNAGVPSIQ